MHTAHSDCECQNTQYLTVLKDVNVQTHGNTFLGAHECVVRVPLCKHFLNRSTLSPAPHHPGRVKGSKEASGATRPHGPEGLHREYTTNIQMNEYVSEHEETKQHQHFPPLK